MYSGWESGKQGVCQGERLGAALEGRVLKSLEFQPQAGGGGHVSRLGLKPQAGEYPPFQGGQRCMEWYGINARPTASTQSPAAPPSSASRSPPPGPSASAPPRRPA